MVLAPVIDACCQQCHMMQHEAFVCGLQKAVFQPMHALGE